MNPNAREIHHGGPVPVPPTRHRSPGYPSMHSAGAAVDFPNPARRMHYTHVHWAQGGVSPSTLLYTPYTPTVRRRRVSRTLLVLAFVLALAALAVAWTSPQFSGGHVIGAPALAALAGWVAYRGLSGGGRR